MKELYSQLNRLDPANKCIAMGGFVDMNLATRVQSLEKLIRENPECPATVGFDHIHRGKRDAREPTKVTLLEFLSYSDREKAFKYLQSKDALDITGAKLGTRLSQKQKR